LLCTATRFVLDPKEAVDLVDENTIMVCCILGTTYTGQYEDVKAVNDLLLEKNKKEGFDCHIHVDAASGGFVAPFVNPNLVWDFQLPLVASINTSGHKYGLSYAGVGWALWRDRSFLPDEILFTVNYLGADQISFTLNFSKSGVQVLSQYYQLIRLGKTGYFRIMSNLTTISDYIAKSIAEMDDGKRFEILSEGGGKGLPLVAWKLKDSDGKFDEFAIAHALRSRGWIVPAYTMAPHSEKLKLLRVVIRSDFSRSRADNLLRDLRDTLAALDKIPQHIIDYHKAQREKSKAKHHFVDVVHSLKKFDKTHPVC